MNNSVCSVTVILKRNQAGRVSGVPQTYMDGCLVNAHTVDIVRAKANARLRFDARKDLVERGALGACLSSAITSVTMLQPKNVEEKKNAHV
jgi:hypothetical protein